MVVLISNVTRRRDRRLSIMQGDVLLTQIDGNLPLRIFTTQFSLLIEMMTWLVQILRQDSEAEYCLLPYYLLANNNLKVGSNT